MMHTQKWHRKNLKTLAIIGLIACALPMAGWAQPTVERGRATGMILEPLSLSAMAAFSPEDDPTMEFSVGGGLRWGPYRLTGRGRISRDTFALNLNAAAQLDPVGVFAGVRHNVADTGNNLADTRSSAIGVGTQVFAGARTRGEAFELSGQLGYGRPGISVNSSGALQLGPLELSASGRFAPQAMTLSGGGSLRLAPVTLSVTGETVIPVVDEAPRDPNEGGPGRRPGGGPGGNDQASQRQNWSVTVAGRYQQDRVQLSLSGRATGQGLSLSAQGRFGLEQGAVFAGARWNAQNGVGGELGGAAYVGGMEAELTTEFDLEGVDTVTFGLSAEFNLGQTRPGQMGSQNSERTRE